MAADVVFAPSADDDLDSIAGHIANPQAALAVVRDLRARCLSLVDFPMRGRRYNITYRTLVVTPYLIFYRVEGEAVVIVRVLHGAQNIERVFRDV
jgi:plasmid stabilization system protein ParE